MAAPGNEPESAIVDDGCALCGTPIALAGDRYCCSGCARVAEILAASGFAGDPREAQAFVQAQRAGLIPGEVAPSSPASASETADNAALRDFPLEIDGMWCPSCAWLIEHVLETTPGVCSARVAFVADRADIRFDPAVVGRDALTDKVRELGYDVRPIGSKASGRGLWLRFGLSAVLAINVMMLSYAYYGYRTSPVLERVAEWLPWLLALLTAPVIGVAGWPILRRGIAAALRGSVTMDTLITTATTSAFAFSIYGAWHGYRDLYFDVAAALITFWLLGRLIELSAFRKAIDTTDAVRRLLPRKAQRKDHAGLSWIEVEALQPGDRICVAAGERVAVDGTLLSDEAIVSTAVIDGEPRPRRVVCGDAIPGGATVGAAAIELRVTAPAGSSVLGRIADHVATVAARTGDDGGISDALARLLLPVVMGLALVTGAAWLAQGLPFAVSFERALAVLVVSCPCALAVAAPLARVVTASALARIGIIARGEGAVDGAAQATCVAFDKTGTLTRGEMSVAAITVSGIERGEALALLAALETRAGHPIAAAVQRATSADLHPDIEDIRIEAGCGVRGTVGTVPLIAGRPDWVGEAVGNLPAAIEAAVTIAQHAGQTAVVFAKGDKAFAAVALDDQLRNESPEVVQQLTAMGLPCVVLSGDAQTTVTRVARDAGIHEGYGDLRAEEKAEWLVYQTARSGAKPLFVGDGVNDAPALAAGIGVAVASGTDFARETAAVLMLDASLEKIPLFVAAARRMKGIIKQNLGWAVAYNIFAIALAASGQLDPVVAAAAMVGSSVLVTVNSLRLGEIPNPERNPAGHAALSHGSYTNSSRAP